MPIIATMTKSLSDRCEPGLRNALNSFLVSTLTQAGFEDAHEEELEPIGHVVRCTYEQGCHIVVPLILAPIFYETTRQETATLAMLLISAETDENMLAIQDALGDAILDVASICLDLEDSKARIHHVQDILCTSAVTPPEQHFFIDVKPNA
jgi:hypothetical protein